MTWHLKDRELEKKLIAIDPKFLERINEGSVLKDNLRMDTCMMITDHVAVRFEAKDFEEVPEYNPKIWNDSRKVTPPEGVVFRAKVYRAEGETVLYECLIFRRSVWYHVINGKPLGIQFSLYEGDYVEFRPWEDKL